MKRVLAVCTAWLVLVSGVVVPAQTTGEAERLMESAHRAAVIEHDLRKALDLYRRIAEGFKSQPSIAARALLEAAALQELQDSEAARATYERIITQFTTETDIVNEARNRRAALGVSTSTLPAARLVVNDRNVDPQGTVSQDGRWMAMADQVTGELAIRDLISGQVRPLKARDCAGAAQRCRPVQTPVFSPDGRRIAYTWGNDALPQLRGELRVISVEPNAKPVTLASSQDMDFWPQDWSLDGKTIVLTMRSWTQRVYQIGTIAAAGGSPKILKSFPHAFGFRPTMSPDGKFIAYSARPTPDSAESYIYVLATDGSGQKVLVQNAGGNRSPAWAPDGEHLLFTSARTGNSADLWSVAVRDGSQTLVKSGLGPAQILPNGITRTGLFFYTRSEPLNEIAIAALRPRAGQPRRPSVTTGSRPRWSPDGKSFAYVRTNAVARTHFDIVVRNVESGAERTYFGRDINMSPGFTWFADSAALLVPVEEPVGTWSLKRLNLKTEEYAKALDVTWNQQPRTSLAPDGRTLFVLASPEKDTARSNTVDIYDLASGIRRSIGLSGSGAVNGIQVSPDGSSLLLVINDGNGGRLSILPTTGGTLREIYQWTSAALTNVTWDKGSQALLFGRRDANGGDRWALVRLSIDGGSPESLGFTMDGAITNVSFSPDQSQVAWASTATTHEVWAIGVSRPAKAAR